MKNVFYKFIILFFIAGFVISCSEDMDDEAMIKKNSNVVLDEGIFFELPNCLVSHKIKNSDTVNLDSIRKYPTDTALINILRSIMGEVSDFTDNLSSSLFSLQIGNGGFEYGIDLTNSEKNSYYSSDDSKAKQSTVLQGGDFEGESYDFTLTISDNSERKNEQIALKAYYDTIRGTSDRGCVIFKPTAYNQVRYPNDIYKSTVCRIDYNFTKDVFYNDIKITSLPARNGDNNVFYVKNLHLYISCSDNIYSIYGNAYLPNLWFDKISNAGYNLCFVITADYTNDKAVVYTSIVKSNFQQTNCRSIIEQYAAGNILENMFPIWKKLSEKNNVDFYPFDNPSFLNTDGYKGSGDVSATDFVSIISDANLLLNNNFKLSPAEVSVMTINFE